jgi:hypothetical protein
LKTSGATSATATVPPAATARSSANPKPPSPTTAEILSSVVTLSGHSDPPDPAFNAYRKDLADIALAGRVIASHYAEPLHRTIAQPTALLAGPSGEAEVLCELASGERFEMLDDSVGWAWGYAGSERRVGYVRSEAVTAA